MVGNEAVPEGCDHWFVFTECITQSALLYMPVIYVHHYVCSFSQIAVFSVVLIRESIYYYRYYYYYAVSYEKETRVRDVSCVVHPIIARHRP